MGQQKRYIPIQYKKNALPENFIPFSSDLGGNKICLDVKTDHIYIVYMDLGNPMKNPDAKKKMSAQKKLSFI